MTTPAETYRPESEGLTNRLGRRVRKRTRFLRVIKTFQNWHLIYLSRRGLLRTPQFDLKTRSGLRITVRSRTSDLRTTSSLLVDRSYLHGCPELPEDAVVVDVGAHIGCFTLLSSQLAPKGQVFSFEPEPANFELLEGNVRRNGLGQVRLFRMAMAEAEGERELHYSIKKSTTGGHSLYGRGSETVKVKVTTLERVVRDHGIDRIDFLKLDCEGAEWDLLRVAARDVLGRIRRGAAEVHGENRSALEPFLKEVGFQIYGGPKPNYLYFTRP